MSSTSTGGSAGERHPEPRRKRVTRALSAVAILAGVLGCAPAMAAWELNMPRGVTPISRDAYDQHMLMLYWCIGIGVVVFGAMFYSMWRHRRSVGHEAAHFHHSTLAEITWTVIPVLILVSMAIPATKALIKIEDMSNSDMRVRITGYQWKWHYDYLDEGVSFFSNLALASRKVVYGDPTTDEHYLLEVDKPLVLPVGKKVHFLITSEDVIHAWWVPALGQKKDAIPGFINEMWTRIEKPGVYRGQCAELCGKGHGFMPIVVVAKPPDEYAKWLAEHKQATKVAAAEPLRTWTKADLVAHGKEVYTAHCQACHQPNGQGLPPQFPPLHGSAVVTGPIDAHLKVVLNGRPGTAMQAFGKQLSDTDIAAVITYERNGLNQVGDMIQPADVQAARQ